MKPSATPSMTRRNYQIILFSFCLAVAATMSAGPLFAQTPAKAPNTSRQTPAQKDPAVSITRPANEAAEPHPWTREQIVTCTVSQCWQLSGKSEDTFFDIVEDLAAMSAQNRGLVLPESQAAGRRAGEMIKAKAKLDHDQLLYAVVDDAVRKVGKPAAAK